jgi:hypothetical protein
MKNIVFIFAIFGAVSAQAKTYFDDSTAKAIIFYFQGEKVNASVCEQISEQELRGSSQESLKLRCQPLSPNGLSRSDIEAKLPQLKQQMLASISALGGMINDMGKTTDDKKFADMWGGMADEMFAQEKKAIESLTADEVFQAYQVEARVPTLEKVEKSQDFDAQIKQFVLFTLN